MKGRGSEEPAALSVYLRSSPLLGIRWEPLYGEGATGHEAPPFSPCSPRLSFLVYHGEPVGPVETLISGSQHKPVGNRPGPYIHTRKYLSHTPREGAGLQAQRGP